ncbi:hypothetical protein [Sphingomonas sp. Leaf21]|uniref:hypothetical protein n=1 Tax=Sphingomonas sp. Leaf21 TaxID=2876550 RepID=UPI001E482E8A|nr:hypothetical protein [Sphingomonas sp. Leaf21]
MMFAMLATAVALSAPTPRDPAIKPASIAVDAGSLPTASVGGAKPVRYCFLNVEQDHVQRGKVCMTRKQWLWRDIDPLDYIGRNK